MQAVEKEGAAVWNYVFDKGFHVSPFMGMDHVYDWCVSALSSATLSQASLILSIGSTKTPCLCLLPHAHV